MDDDLLGVCPLARDTEDLEVRAWDIVVVAPLEAGVQDDLVAERYLGDTLSEGGDDAGAVGAEHRRQRGSTPAPDPPVTAVERGGDEIDDGLARTRHRIVEHDQIIGVRKRLEEAFLSIESDIDREALLFQAALDKAGDFSFVFHEENAHG